MVDERHALSILLNLTRSLTDDQALEDSLQVVTDAALELFPGDHCSVRLLDDTRTELLCWARSGAGADKRPVAFLPGEGVSGWVAEHGKVVRVDETSSDRRFMRVRDQGFQVRSLIGVPLWSGGNVIGVMSISAPTPGAFGPEDEVMARLLANSAVPHIERARLARLAVTDPETMTFNERYLFPRLREEIARSQRYGRPLTMLMLALDRFDTLADPRLASSALRAFADRTTAAVRRPDVLIRHGRVVFVLVMPATSCRDGRMVAERIRGRQAAARTEVPDAEPLTLTVSVGVATWDGHESAEALEYRAEQALRSVGADGVAVAEGDVEREAAQDAEDGAAL